MQATKGIIKTILNIVSLFGKFMIITHSFRFTQVQEAIYIGLFIKPLLQLNHIHMPQLLLL